MLHIHQEFTAKSIKGERKFGEYIRLPESFGGISSYTSNNTKRFDLSNCCRRRLKLLQNYELGHV